MSETIVVRPARASDLNFIYATWLRGLYYGNSFYAAIAKDIYFAKYGPVVERVVALTDVRVACLADDEDVVLGYAVIGGTRLHWCFVKQAWRRRGIAKQLVGRSEITSVSHLTRPGDAIRKAKQWFFNPFL